VFVTQQARRLDARLYPHAVSRRTAIRAGALGLMGLSLPELLAARAEADAAAAGQTPRPRAKSVIYIFLSGGLSQIDSFDMKPEAPEKYRGEFQSIATKTPGLQICEHLPFLAERSDRWAICRSVTHPYNEHSEGHMVMLSGRTELPPGFSGSKPQPGDWPSIAAISSEIVPDEGTLPSTMVLPDRIVHRSGRVIPGQFAGRMGPSKDPWFLEASAFTGKTYGAYPAYDFHHQRGRDNRGNASFNVPQLGLPEHLTRDRFKRRLEILDVIQQQQRELEVQPRVGSFRRYQDLAVKLLNDPKTRSAFDIAGADPALLERYGNNSFGWSLLVARQLVESGVRLVQVNLGNNETWDTHVNAFHNLKNFLFPPTDRAVSALLDDLGERGLLDDTLVVMAGEFGRTPRIFSIGSDNPPGRDHWGAVQTVWFAGAGVPGGAIIGSSDAEGGHPKDDPQKPENLAATIFDALGVPRGAHWKEQRGRPHPIYRAEPIPGLL